MAYTIPYSEKPYQPVCIPGNDAAPDPVTFLLSAVGGASRARLKSIIHASEGLELDGWTPELQESVIRAFELGGLAFVDGCQKISGLSVPARLAQKVGLITELPPNATEDTKHPITNGYEFSRVCFYFPTLAFEIAMQIAKLSGEADIDPRFFTWLSTLLATPNNRVGTAARVERARVDSGTAGSGTRAAKRRRSTSRRGPSSSADAAATTASRS